MEKKHLPPIAWHLIQLPKTWGGLSVGNLLHKNLALLFKWLWRFMAEPQALWRKVIHDKYGYKALTCATDFQRPKFGGPWKSICSSLLCNTHVSKMVSTCIRKRWVMAVIPCFGMICGLVIGHLNMHIQDSSTLAQIKWAPLHPWAYGTARNGSGAWDGKGNSDHKISKSSRAYWQPFFKSLSPLLIRTSPYGPLAKVARSLLTRWSWNSQRLISSL